jgi:hypothetical protein
MRRAAASAKRRCAPEGLLFPENHPARRDAACDLTLSAPNESGSDMETVLTVSAPSRPAFFTCSALDYRFFAIGRSRDRRRFLRVAHAVCLHSEAKANRRG